MLGAVKYGQDGPWSLVPCLGPIVQTNWAVLGRMRRAECYPWLPMQVEVSLGYLKPCLYKGRTGRLGAVGHAFNSSIVSRPAWSYSQFQATLGLQETLPHKRKLHFVWAEATRAEMTQSPPDRGTFPGFCLGRCPHGGQDRNSG